jgi:EthD domain
VRGAQVEPYDGVAELWWDSYEEFAEAGATPEGRRAGRALLEDERNFIDLPKSPLFFTTEHVIIG